VTGFGDAEAFRASVEQRIRNASQASGTPHDRLRKDTAFNRLVARFVAAGDDRWALKGGVALLWRVAVDARATRDVDANWHGTTSDLEAFLDGAVEADMDDWFEFEIAPPRPLQGETEKGLRFGVTALLAGREFSAFRLDVNLVSDDRPVETIRIRQPLLSSMGLGDLDVPMISIAQQLAEKLHAVTRTYASGDSSRAKDAYDTMLFAQAGLLPEAGVLRSAVVDTFMVRDTRVPRAAPSIPADWRGVLVSLLDAFGLAAIEDVEALEGGWMSLWQPIVNGGASDSASWNIETCSWEAS